MTKKMLITVVAALLLICLLIPALADGTAWTCTGCGRTGNTGNFCPNCGRSRPQDSSWTCPKCGTKNYSNYCTYCGASKSSASQAQIYALAAQKLAINSGPGTKTYFKELGTYDVKGQYVEVLAKAYDPNNGIWWLKVRIPGTNVTGWTGKKRFDDSTYDINAVPTESWWY
ncbi:MAG: hypothetical protein IJ242_12365 [Clostridia bacterium]|nr:hypothetical protein [Clostridia bacterium]